METVIHVGKEVPHPNGSCKGPGTQRGGLGALLWSCGALGELEQLKEIFSINTGLLNGAWVWEEAQEGGEVSPRRERGGPQGWGRSHRISPGREIILEKSWVLFARLKKHWENVYFAWGNQTKSGIKNRDGIRGGGMWGIDFRDFLRGIYHFHLWIANSHP